MNYRTYLYHNILFFLLLLLLSTCAMEPRLSESTSTDKKTTAHEKVFLQQPNTVSVKYPKTLEVAGQDNFFGTSVTAPYRWLEELGDPMLEAWVEKQQKVSYNYLNAIPQKKGLQQRLETLWNYERYSAPFRAGDSYYYFYNSGFLNQDILYQCQVLDKTETAKIILDPNALDGHPTLLDLKFSKHANFMAFSTIVDGPNRQRLQILEIATGRILTDIVYCDQSSTIAWHGNGFYYSRFAAQAEQKQVSSKNEFHQIWYHKLGTKQQDDELIFADPSHPNYMFHPTVTDDERLLLISASTSNTGNAIFYKLLNKKDSYVEPLISNFMDDFEFIANKANKLIFRSNHQAPNYQLIEIDLKKPSEKDWNILVPQMPDLLETAKFVGHRLVLQFIKDVRNILKVYELDGQFVGNLPLPEFMGEGTPVTISALSGQKGFPIGSFSLSSFTVPPSACIFDINTLQSEVWQQPKLDFSPQDYVTEQVFYKQGSLDGDTVTIPMFITRKKGLEKNGLNPTILYGYGGFNRSLMPTFDLAYIPFLEAGGIYAVANIRGGGEYGQKWHEQGMLLNKQNTFNDFIAAAEYLIAKKYTNPQKLAIEGRGHGGLLVGVCMTQRPELFRVALPSSGLFDMLRYPQFTTNSTWVAEYGSSDTEERFRNLLSYSPLHNVIATKYPATFIITGGDGDRFSAIHAYKFAAALQQKQQGQLPMLLYIDKNKLPFHKKSTTATIEAMADKLAFVIFNLQ